MEVIEKPIPLSTIETMAEEMFGDLVKAVVDLDRGLMAIGGVMHADEEALLLGQGSRQRDLWGINLHPAQFGTTGFVGFDSMINIRPGQGNRSRSVDDPAIRTAIMAIVERLVTS